jgi:hypothetical protein
MDRAILIEHLALAERHAAEGERILEHQRAIIDDLRHRAHSAGMTEEAERLLLQFEEAQSLHLADAARLRKELSIPG